MEIANLLRVELTLDAERFDAGLSDAERKTEAFERKASGSFKKTGLSARGMAGEVRGAASRMVAENDNVAQSARRAALGMDGMFGAAHRLAGALGAVAGALAASALTGYADAWSDMQSRVGAAIKDMEAAPAMMERLVDIANASYSPLEQTVEIYSRNVAVLRDLGRGATDAADFTEALNHALVITATRGERAASVQNALSKAMAVGKLQADGLETVLANGGEVAQALADELGTNVNGLRAMASAGKITGDVIANALISRLEDLRDRAGEMPATIGDAFTRLQTNLTAFIGRLDQSTGATQRLSAAIMLVADNIDVIARVAAVAGVALMTAFAPAILAAMASGLLSIGAAGMAAMRALTIAIMANPLGALAVAITTAVTAIYLFRDEIHQAIGVDVVGIVKNAANLVIGSFVAAYEDIKFVWGSFPDIMGVAVIGAANATISGIEKMINAATGLLNGFIDKVNAALSMLPGGLEIGKIGDVSIGRFNEGDIRSRLAGAVGDRNSAVQAALGRDYIGDLADMLWGSTSEAQRLASALDAATESQDFLGHPKECDVNLSAEQIDSIHDLAAAFGQEIES